MVAFITFGVYAYGGVTLIPPVDGQITYSILWFAVTNPLEIAWIQNV
jgi:hypothetical protein